jgi:homopolymeric O-antigen transport system ATP-binding protein
MSIAIKVENLSKLYRLGEIGTGTISYDLQRWLAKMRGKEDPFLKIGEANDRTKMGGDIVYSLNSLNFEIRQGEAVGIIGRNGAGKSTLLKILSRVTSPTTGRINIKGRVASLLEVGTGFHPELTGKENIYLNGAILGMRKKEIDRKLDAIVDFSGVERYIDTPVKRYSSGMYVRLAFAVAAHLESEILIVDEVLAVGDAEFQKRCLGKMNEVSKGEGKTVLFVSHHMPSIKALCTEGIILKNGSVDFKGNVKDTIERYFEAAVRLNEFGIIPDGIERYNTGEAKFRSIVLLDSNNNTVNEVYFKESLKFNLSLEVFKTIKDALVDVKICTVDGIVITHSMNVLDGAGLFSFDTGEHELSLELENNLQPGNYSITIGLHNSTYGTATIDYVENVFNFMVTKVSNDPNTTDYNLNFIYGYVRPKAKWLRKKNNYYVSK